VLVTVVVQVGAPSPPPIGVSADVRVRLDCLLGGLLLIRAR
jgi:hypothetical protein